MLLSLPTEVLGVMKASGVISLGIVPLLGPAFDRKSLGAGSDGIFLRSVWEPLPDSLSELWSVRWSENPAGHTKCKEYFIYMAIFDIQRKHTYKVLYETCRAKKSTHLHRIFSQLTIQDFYRILH